MSRVNKIAESLKILAGAAFAIFAIWEINTGNITEDLVVQLITLLAAIIGGLLGGSSWSRFRRGLKEGFR